MRMKELAQASELNKAIAESSDPSDLRLLEKQAQTLADAWKAVHKNVVKANEFKRAACEAAVKIGEILGPTKSGKRHDIEPSHASEGFDKDARHRYRKLSAVGPAKRADFYQKCRGDNESISQNGLLRFGGGSVVSLYTGEDEWYTPSEYVESVRSVLGSIDLDPASSEQANEIVRAEKYFTKDDDGLVQDWSGNVFLNPPYKQPLVAQFTAKLIESHESGDVNAAVLLTNNSTDTKWWQHAAMASTAACFTAGRIKFYRDKEYDAPTNGQVFLFFGRGSNSFVREFEQYGWIAVPEHG